MTSSLQEIYNCYVETANELVPNWQSRNKNELCFAYIDEPDDYLKQGYMAAIICKYWPKVYRFYKDTSLVCELEDCYDWLIESILITLRDRPWERSGDKLAKDPNAPDKVINCIMKCTRINHIVSCNRDKRKANINVASKDEIDENVGEDTATPEELTNAPILNTDDVDQIITIRYLFDKQLYLLLFCYDAIINLDCFHSGTFSDKKLVKQISTLSDSYIVDLANKCGLNPDNLLYAYKCSIKTKSTQQLKDNVSTALYNLRLLYFTDKI